MHTVCGCVRDDQKLDETEFVWKPIRENQHLNSGGLARIISSKLRSLAMIDHQLADLSYWFLFIGTCT